MPARKGPKPKKSVTVKKATKKRIRPRPKPQDSDTPFSKPAGTPGAAPSPDEVL